MFQEVYRKMYHGLKGLEFIFLMFLIGSLQAQNEAEPPYQDVKQDAEERYGPEAELINGEKYNYPYRSDSGDPFFESGASDIAAVQINGRMYDDQKIKYDIYNQLMVLEYTNSSGAPESIVLRNEWLDFVLIGDRRFRLFPEEDGSPRFGQVINDGAYSCVYFWEKRYIPNLSNVEKQYSFSTPIRHAYVVVQEQFTSYKSKGSFLKCFPKPLKPTIKQYMKEHRIRFRKAADVEMNSLMRFINNIPGNEE
jgi:hypothetical protein